jgi:glycosyltransferase involved in cell wall biosynthesis
LLSVIIPTFKSEATIERCLASLACQTYQNFEICIIDGASSDNTIAKANQFRSQFKNIRILSESDKGTYDAMNKGIDIAQGDWIYFLGSDDEVHDENVFSDIFRVIPEKKCGILYGNVRINGDTSWAKDGQLYDGEFRIQQLLTRNICHQAMFYRRKLFNKLGKYNLRYPVCADWELNIRFFSRTQSVYLDRTIANFYGGGLSSGAINDPIGNDFKSLRKQALYAYKFHQITSFIKL